MAIKCLFMLRIIASYDISDELLLEIRYNDLLNVIIEKVRSA